MIPFFYCARRGRPGVLTLILILLGGGGGGGAWRYCCCKLLQAGANNAQTFFFFSIVELNGGGHSESFRWARSSGMEAIVDVEVNLGWCGGVATESMSS